ncbi:hypothetical protein SeMB42_g00482 [Synchytrium endobioticum]|uniref:Uncharacterized protein n=1 Tax=Synchytrium endobioticum TaxID=286115 RepID=A0A507DII4_9FUNG|nr:hypothetical protein SeLEV6574_g00342 [Synchytrium endobioticum]TPX54042.1 hypothetical protein SeMB42_g00482 [Synchytrium endobioticum]
MATRRNASSIAQCDEDVSPSNGKSSTATIPTSVVVKLLGFSIAIFVFPIATYFYTLNRVFQGNLTYAAISAVVMVNVILVAFVVVAFTEDSKVYNKVPGKKD